MRVFLELHPFQVPLAFFANVLLLKPHHCILEFQVSNSYSSATSKRKKIYTYCSGGYRGNIAADELNKQGFNAITIEGGYSAWKKQEKEK